MYIKTCMCITFNLIVILSYVYDILVIAVIFYHLGCYAEYKLGIEDTARLFQSMEYGMYLSLVANYVAQVYIYNYYMK